MLYLKSNWYYWNNPDNHNNINYKIIVEIFTTYITHEHGRQKRGQGGDGSFLDFENFSKENFFTEVTTDMPGLTQFK